VRKHVLNVDVRRLALPQCVAAFSIHSFSGETPPPVVRTCVCLSCRHALPQECTGTCAHELGCVHDRMSLLTGALRAVLPRQEQMGRLPCTLWVHICMCHGHPPSLQSTLTQLWTLARSGPLWIMRLQQLDSLQLGVFRARMFINTDCLHVVCVCAHGRVCVCGGGGGCACFFAGF
jgi:hypothetical protein